MNEQKFKVLWEYGIASKAKPSEDDLLRVCSMYLSEASFSDEDKALYNTEFSRLLESWTDNKALLAKVVTDKKLGALLASTASQKKPAAAAGPTSKLKSILDDLDDEEEDSSVHSEGSSSSSSSGEEEEDETQKQPPVVMKGFVKKKEDGKVEWTGSWAISSEAFAANDKAKFRFDLNPCEGFDMDDKIIRAVPTTTFWTGSFLVKNEAEGFVRMDEKNVEFTFDAPLSERKWALKGKGENVSGAFTLEGELDGNTRKLALLKTYIKRKKTTRKRDESSDDDEDSEDDELDPTELEDLAKDRQQDEERKKPKLSS